MALTISENGSSSLRSFPPGKTTCSDSTCSSGAVSGEFVSPNPNLCTGFSQYDGTLTIVWSGYPDSSSLEFNWIDAFMCGTGSISAQYSNGSPGSYEGTFLLTDFSGTGCNSISIPFSFTITDEELPPVVADIEWNNGTFNGDTTCSTYGMSMVGSMTLPDAMSSISNRMNTDSRPMGPCPMAVTSNSTMRMPGFVRRGHQPRILSRIARLLPRTVRDSTPWVLPVHPRPLLLHHHRRRPPTSHRRHRVEQRDLRRRHHMQHIRIFDGYFNEIGGFTGCEWPYDESEYGLSVQWDSLPDTNFQFNWVEASLCGNGYIYGDFSGGTRILPRTVRHPATRVLPVHPGPLLLHHHRRRAATRRRRHRMEQRALQWRHHMQHVRVCRWLVQ